MAAGQSKNLKNQDRNSLMNSYPDFYAAGRLSSLLHYLVLEIVKSF